MGWTWIRSIGFGHFVRTEIFTMLRSFLSLRAFPKPTTMLMQCRTKMKTHKSSAKRLIRTGTGIKRKQAGRNHGNGGFSSNSLRHLDSFVPVTTKGDTLKKLDKFMP